MGSGDDRFYSRRDPDDRSLVCVCAPRACLVFGVFAWWLTAKTREAIHRGGRPSLRHYKSGVATLAKKKSGCIVVPIRRVPWLGFVGEL